MLNICALVCIGALSLPVQLKAFKSNFREFAEKNSFSNEVSQSSMRTWSASFPLFGSSSKLAKHFNADAVAFQGMCCWGWACRAGCCLRVCWTRWSPNARKQVKVCDRHVLFTREAWKAKATFQLLAWQIRRRREYKTAPFAFLLFLSRQDVSVICPLIVSKLAETIFTI